MSFLRSLTTLPNPTLIDKAPNDLTPAQEQIPILPAYIKEDYTWTPGAGAVSKDIPLAKAPIAAIILNFDALGNSGAATQANMLTQWGTFIYVKDGGTDVTPRWTGAELAEYHKGALGTDIPFQDGTAANDKLALMQIVIPFGRPVYRPIFPTALIDPLVAFKPDNTPYLHIEAPADGNTIDTRHLKVTTVYHPYGANVPYDKRWTDWGNQTVSTSALTDWTIGDKGQWLETMIYATSAYNDTLASDAPSVLDVEVERSGQDVVFSGAVPNVLGSCLDTDVTAEDSYLYNSFSYRGDPLNLCPTLTSLTNLRVLGGVADAVKAAFSVIRKK